MEYKKKGEKFVKKNWVDTLVDHVFYIIYILVLIGGVLLIIHGEKL